MMRKKLWHVEEVGPGTVRIVEDVPGGLREWYKLTGERYIDLVREQEEKGLKVVE